MSIGANFLATLGLLNSSVMLANLCTKLDSASSSCSGQEKGIIAFVCLCCGFLLLQAPNPQPSHSSHTQQPHTAQPLKIQPQLLHQPSATPQLARIVLEASNRRLQQTLFLALWSRPEVGVI